MSCTAVQLAASQGLSATIGHHRNGGTVSDSCAVVLAARVKFERPVRTTAKKCRFAGRHTMKRRKICIVFFGETNCGLQGVRYSAPKMGSVGCCEKSINLLFF